MQPLVLFVLLLLIPETRQEEVDLSYHSATQVQGTLEALHKNYPRITHLYSIGETNEERKMWVLAIGKHAINEKPLVPNVQYVGNIHGNEPVGRELLLLLGEHLLQQYADNNTIKDFLDQTTVHLLPSMNPDGAAVSEEGCYPTVGSENAKGVNLYQNFPDKTRTDDDVTEPETQNVINWIKDRQFVLSAVLTAGDVVVVYPYSSVPNDEEIYRFLASRYAQTHPTMSQGEECGQTYQGGMANGAEFFCAAGTLPDYLYTFAGCYAVELKISCCKFPPERNIRDHWEKNKDALINFMLSVHMGVKGLVQTPAANGNLVPVPNAVVFVEGKKEIKFKSSKRGEYYKLLLPGDYVIEVTHPSYITTRVNVTVGEGVTRLDITLTSALASADSSTTPDAVTSDVTRLEHDVTVTKAPMKLDRIGAGNMTPSLHPSLVVTIVTLLICHLYSKM